MRRSAFSRVLYARTLTMWGLCRLFLPCLFHPRGLPLQVAQEVQLGAADLRGPEDLDPIDDGRMQREDALDTPAERHFAHRERRARPATVHPDHHAFEHL